MFQEKSMCLSNHSNSANFINCMNRYPFAARHRLSVSIYPWIILDISMRYNDFRLMVNCMGYNRASLLVWSQSLMCIKLTIQAHRKCFPFFYSFQQLYCGKWQPVLCSSAAFTLSFPCMLNLFHLECLPATVFCYFISILITLDFCKEKNCVTEA
jgi:hypothetical protein